MGAALLLLFHAYGEAVPDVATCVCLDGDVQVRIGIACYPETKIAIDVSPQLTATLLGEKCEC